MTISSAYSRAHYDISSETPDPKVIINAIMKQEIYKQPCFSEYLLAIPRSVFSAPETEIFFRSLRSQMAFLDVLNCWETSINAIEPEKNDFNLLVRVDDLRSLLKGRRLSPLVLQDYSTQYEQKERMIDQVVRIRLNIEKVLGEGNPDARFYHKSVVDFLQDRKNKRDYAYVGNDVLCFKRKRNTIKVRLLTGEMIGRGCCGVVWRAVDLVSGGSLVYKEPIAHERLDTAGMLANEYHLLKQIHGGERVRGIQPRPKLIKEYPNKGNIGCLFHRFDGDLTSKVFDSKSFKNKLIALGSLLDGLFILHQKRIIHSDIKPENCGYLEEDNECILIDFGGARQLLDVFECVGQQPLLGAHTVLGVHTLLYTSYTDSLEDLELYADRPLSIGPQEERTVWERKVARLCIAHDIAALGKTLIFALVQDVVAFRKADDAVKVHEQVDAFWEGQLEQFNAWPVLKHIFAWMISRNIEARLKFPVLREKYHAFVKAYKG